MKSICDMEAIEVLSLRCTQTSESDYFKEACKVALNHITRLHKIRDDAMIPYIRDQLGRHSAATDNYSSLNRFLEML